MSRYTFLRVDVDSDVVARVLGLTPGVEVVETLDGERGETAPAPSGDGPADVPGGGPSDHDPSDDGGSIAGVTPSDDVLDEGSPVREYGLLGLGVGFVTLGIATVGIWWYRRRSGSEGDAETPPPATEFESPGESSTPAPTDAGDESAREGAADDTETDGVNLVLDRDEGKDEAAAEADTDGDDSERDETGTVDAGADTEPTGQSEAREEVEWEPKWSDSPAEPSIDPEEADDDDDADAVEPRQGESVDAAPLLGIAFVAITGALVRWAQGESDPDET